MEEGVAVLTLSLTKSKFVIDTNDNSTFTLTKKKTLSKKQREKNYGIKLKESEADAKIIKLCDISANLGNLKNQVISKTKKRRVLKELRYYLSIIEKDIIEDIKYQNATILLETVNQNLKIQTQTISKSKENRSKKMQ